MWWPTTLKALDRFFGCCLSGLVFAHIRGQGPWMAFFQEHSCCSCSGSNSKPHSVSLPDEREDGLVKITKMLQQLLPRGLVGWLAYYFAGRRRTYSQYGEDIFLAELLPEQEGVYVDVGAFHPKYGSNTYQLWRRGWRGINIDVDVYKLRLFDRFRPGDINVQAAVSNSSGQRVFYTQAGGSYGSMSSLEPAFAADRGSRLGREIVEQQVSVVTLNELLATHLTPANRFSSDTVDLLSMDVEGHEMAVLQGLDLDRYRPRVICVEIHADDIDDLQSHPVFLYLREHGYRLHTWPRPSCLFINKNFSVAE